VRVLIVDDRAVDAELAEREVRRALRDCVFARVDTSEAYLAALDTFQPDLILSDYSMPVFDGLAAVRLALQHAPLVPVIIVTAAINEDTAVECMKAGAVDYVIKEHIKRLGQAAVQALEQKKVQRARRQAEYDLRIKSFALETSTAPICLGDLDGRVFYTNDAFQQLAQRTSDEMLGLSIADFAESPLEARAKLDALRRTRRHFATGRFCRRDGSIVDVQLSGSVVTSHDGEPLCLMCAFIDLSDRRALEDSLRRNIAENRAILDAVPDAFFRLSADGTVTGFHAPRGGERQAPAGWVAGEHAGRALPEPIAARIQAAVREALSSGAVVTVEYALPAEHDHEVMEFEARVVSAAEGEALVIVRDITDRKRAERERERLEHQLEQVRKMESIGQLAGGIAHDFNNMLTVVLGNIDLMKMQMAPDHPLEEGILAVEQAALRSKEMARQLLAFSRQQIISPAVLDLNTQIAATRTLFATLIGEQVRVDFVPGAGLWPMLGDPSQIDQILLNLVVNARDAMPRGGAIAIETSNVALDQATCQEVPGADPGEHVVLSVSDDGVGIDPRVLPRIFEPFFTTKHVNKGTGLGLATVYGIVRQNGWFIRVDSAVGRGTTFRIYVPRATEQSLQPRPRIRTAAPAMAVPPAGPRVATILLVEDDEMVRNLTTGLLSSLGYTVLVSESPAEALTRVEDGSARPDLLLSDVVMPMMSGPELRERLAETMPGLRTVLMSGYTSHTAVRQALEDKAVRFIQKPFSKHELDAAIRDLLDG
jgi:PAS domain S-box-containing protein